MYLSHRSYNKIANGVVRDTTQAVSRRSLLSKYNTVSRYTHKCNISLTRIRNGRPFMRRFS